MFKIIVYLWEIVNVYKMYQTDGKKFLLCVGSSIRHNNHFSLGEKPLFESLKSVWKVIMKKSLSNELH